MLQLSEMAVLTKQPKTCLLHFQKKRNFLASCNNQHSRSLHLSWRKMSFHLLTNLKSRPMLEAYDVYFGQFMALMEKSRQERLIQGLKAEEANI